MINREIRVKYMTPDQRAEAVRRFAEAMSKATEAVRRFAEAAAKFEERRKHREYARKSVDPGRSVETQTQDGA